MRTEWPFTAGYKEHNTKRSPIFFTPQKTMYIQNLIFILLYILQAAAKPDGAPYCNVTSAKKGIKDYHTAEKMGFKINVKKKGSTYTMNIINKKKTPYLGLLLYVASKSDKKHIGKFEKVKGFKACKDLKKYSPGMSTITHKDEKEKTEKVKFKWKPGKNDDVEDMYAHAIIAAKGEPGMPNYMSTSVALPTDDSEDEPPPKKKLKCICELEDDPALDAPEVADKSAVENTIPADGTTTTVPATEDTATAADNASAADNVGEGDADPPKKKKSKRDTANLPPEESPKAPESESLVKRATKAKKKTSLKLKATKIGGTGEELQGKMKCSCEELDPDDPEAADDTSADDTTETTKRKRSIGEVDDYHQISRIWKHSLFF